MRISRGDTTLISVLTSDGYVKTLTEDFQIIVSQKRHNLPVTSLVYLDDHIITGSADYTYNFIPIKLPGLGIFSFLSQIIMRSIIVVVFLLLASDYF